MHESIAARAVEKVTGHPPGPTRVLSAGRSSLAVSAEVDDESWVVRIPIEDSDRTTSYSVEAAIGRHLASAGHPVAQWSVLDVDGVRCSIARRLPGGPIDENGSWNEDLATGLARLLQTLHDAPADGFGPLVDDPDRLRGSSVDRIGGLVDRWRHAPLWPFDGSRLDQHPIAIHAPDLVRDVADLSDRIIDAERGAIGVVHSDLHREHILTEDGTLTGVLDFGDAFVGAIAWDFALLSWYYGHRNARLVAHRHDGGHDAMERGSVLAVAVGAYKFAKNPADTAVIPRLRRCLDSVPTT